ncbi:replication-relaxation family protein [Actinomadura sp. SCN-SB]|uniref:replication-relaxation family protein n=1 Tax=Actinomadura sp. SCN-SB TaxID=3373092 RepID=UPI00374FDDDA
MTQPTKTVNRLRGPQARPPRMTPELVADLAYRLTDRDRAVLALVWEHKVLTTDQITTMFFRTPERARQRLNQLYRLYALQRFRPWVPVGSRPWHWVLGPTGAHVLAIAQGKSLEEFGYRQNRCTAIALSPRLGHQVGVNDFFARLHAHARHRTDGTSVDEWWSEQRCAALWGDLARPDAFGRWSEPGPDGTVHTLDFFLEYDNGTEPLARVAAKLGGYADLAESTGTTTPILFWLPSPKREANLRERLGAPEVPVATAVHTPSNSPEGPAGPVWQPAGTGGPRHRLAALAQIWGTPRNREPETP